MNKFSITRRLIRAAIIGLLALTPAMALVVLHAADKTPAPAAGGRLKFLTGKHWTVTQADPKTGLTIFHHGGTYTLKGDEYIETVEYANESTTNLISQAFKFTVKVEGDTLTQTGIGNPWTEIWKRAK